MAEKNFTPMRGKRKNQESQCQICGCPAFYTFYGVTSCQACKMFFKRNADCGQNYLQCSYDSKCQIAPYNRHLCAPCRLRKCFEKGMRIEMIRRYTFNKNKKSTFNALVKSSPIPKLPTLNLLNEDNSTLDNSQWILLSNLFHNYQHSELFSITETIKYENDSLKILNPSTVQNLLRSFYETAGNSLRSNVDIAHLPSDDRSILLHTAANNVTCIGGIIIFYHSQLIHYPLLWKYLDDIYGEIAMIYNRWSAQFTESDMILCKLSITLFTLSTNTRMLCRNVEGEYQNVRQILSIQDKYAEITWKYLLYKYGYEESIKRYLHIIEWFLTLTVFMQYAQGADAHVNDVESLIEHTEVALILDDVDRILDDAR